jgi:hypothetical protein
MSNNRSYVTDAFWRVGMMGLMTAQAPLPVLPARAVAVGDVAGLVVDETGGQVYVRGEVVFAWGPGDEACRRLAAVQLVEREIAATRPVAAAFEVTDQTIWRWRTAYAGQGVASLVGEKKGPKGASKLTEDVVAEIVAGKAAGGSNRAVAAAVGVSEGSVRMVMAAHRAAQRPTDDLEESAEGEQGQAGQDTAGAGQAGSGDLGVAADQDAGDAAQSQAGTDGQDEPEPVQAGTDGQDETEPAGQDAGSVADRDREALPVLADPVPRWAERALARAGLLGAAAPVFTPAARVPLAGLLAGLPGLERTGLLACATHVYGALPSGFYGLGTVLTEAVFRTLAGAPRAEGATRLDPAALGRVLGMDRAPEVKTIRRKLGQLAAAGKAADLIAGMAAHHLDRLTDTEQDQDGLVLYVDGHVRAYQGTKRIAKTHLSRLRFPAPATVETWVCDAAGDPVLVVMAQPGASLAMELRALLPQLRAAVGDDRRVLVGFDRGGWSPALFQHMHQNGFDVLTWRKHPAPDVEAAAFTDVIYTDSHGLEHHWVLADTHVQLPVGDQATFGMRQVTRRDARTGKQAHVLTTREDLPAGEVMYRMGSRWRQENYFRYGRLHLDLDSHDTYTATPDDPSRSVPNPDKRTAHAAVAAAQARVQRERARTDAALLEARTPTDGTGTVLLTNTRHDEITAPLRAAQTDLDAAKARHADTPARVPLGRLSPHQQVLDVETKLLTHAVKMAAFNTITTLARHIRLHTSYARADQEAYTLARHVLTHTGDIDPRTDGVLTIRLDPMPTARETKAVAELCEHLSATNTTYPGTNRLLRYQIKTGPQPARTSP